MDRAPRTIVIPGGSGYLGQQLARYFAQQGDQVIVLSRTAMPQTGNIATLRWDGATFGPWAQALDGADVVINLAGRNVNCRYNAANRRAIYESRLRSTAVIGEAIAHATNPPAVWINASSATIYRHAVDRPMDEATGEIGHGFSVDVCQRWEQALHRAATPQTRKVALRAAMVFGPGRGGVMDAFRMIVRLGLGGAMGDGTQYVSWAHLDDFVRSVAWIIAHEALAGPVNCAAPNPRPNADFMRVFRLACRQPLGMPTTRWMLEIGAVLLRTETELLLKSRRVIPTRLLESGFVFRYPQLYPALEQIVHSETLLSSQ